MREFAGKRILMLLENNPYPHDVRVRKEAHSLIGAGYRVSVISPSPSGGFRFGFSDGIRVYQYPRFREREGPGGYIFEYGWAMLATLVLSLLALSREGFDFIHAHNPPDTFVLIGIVYKMAGKRFVFDHHDLSPEMYRAKFGEQSSGLVLKALMYFEKLTFRFSDIVISTNDSYREIAMARGGVPRDRVFVVRNAPDLERVKLVDPDPELRARASSIFGYVGEMGDQDGVDYLLRAISRLVHDLNRQDVLSVIVGRGDAVSSLKDLTVRLGIEEHVWFTGRISDEDLMSYLSTADICVDPDPSNPFNDRSSMIKMTEYMALAKPIVAFDLPEHRVTAQEAAVYAEPNDELDFARKLAELIDDPARRRRMGELGRSRLETHLSWQQQESRLLEAYRVLSNEVSDSRESAA